jgi:hypothetical protein
MQRLALQDALLRARQIYKRNERPVDVSSSNFGAFFSSWLFGRRLEALLSF